VPECRRSSWARRSASSSTQTRAERGAQASSASTPRTATTSRSTPPTRDACRCPLLPSPKGCWTWRESSRLSLYGPLPCSPRSPALSPLLLPLLPYSPRCSILPTPKSPMLSCDGWCPGCPGVASLPCAGEPGEPGLAHAGRAGGCQPRRWSSARYATAKGYQRPLVPPQKRPMAYLAHLAAHLQLVAGGCQPRDGVLQGTPPAASMVGIEACLSYKVGQGACVPFKVDRGPCVGSIPGQGGLCGFCGGTRGL